MRDYYFGDIAYDLSFLNEAKSDKSNVASIVDTNIDNFGKKFIILSFLSPDDTWDKCKGDGDFDKNILEKVNRMIQDENMYILTEDQRKAIEVSKKIGVINLQTYGQIAQNQSQMQPSETKAEPQAEKPAEQPQSQTQPSAQQTNQQNGQTTADAQSADISDAIADDEKK